MSSKYDKPGVSFIDRSKWDSTTSTVIANSAYWQLNATDISEVAAVSANWNSVYTNVNVNSGDWENVWSQVHSLSDGWTLSGTAVDLGQIPTLSGNWNSVYTTTNSNSALWASNYTTTNTSSANWVWQLSGTTITPLVSTRTLTLPYLAIDNNGLMYATSAGLIEKSTVTISTGPTGGSVLNVVEFSTDPLSGNLIAGDLWITNNIATSGKLLKYWDGTYKYSVELSKE